MLLAGLSSQDPLYACLIEQHLGVNLDPDKGLGISPGLNFQPFKKPFLTNFLSLYFIQMISLEGHIKVMFPRDGKKSPDSFLKIASKLRNDPNVVETTPGKCALSLCNCLKVG